MSDSKQAVELEDIEARIGAVIKDKWTLTRLLGVGGMAAVYEARHEIGRRDAIKIMHPAFAGDAQLVERFKREAVAVNSFEHEGVVEVRDADVTAEGLPFLVMELLEGESVSDKLEHGAIEIEQALAWADALLDVLATAHDHGVVHRDIKPSNLFIEHDGRLRVLDFGVAKLREATGKPITEVGTTLGTLAYMPPEQLEKSDVDQRADVFAAGATLFEMLTGRRVHEADDVESLARKMIGSPAPPLSEVALDVPAPVCRVVDRALAFRAERRYPDASCMRADLKVAVRGDEPPFASALLELDDDPRSKKAPRKRVVQAIAELAAEIESLASTQRAGKTEVDGEKRRARADDEATTVKREVADDEAPTRPRRVESAGVAATEKMATTDPPPSIRPGARRGGSDWMLLLVGAVALAAVILLWRTQTSDDIDSAIDPPSSAETSAADESPRTPESRPDGVDGVDEPDDGAEAPDMAPTEDGADDGADEDGAAHDGSAEAPPRPEPAKPEPAFPFPSGMPTSLPTSLPSSLPTAFPTAIPSALPSSLPTSLPTAFPEPPPPPPPPPEPPTPTPEP